MATYRGYPLFNVADPQTKGIVRARAGHLSLCLEPLVAQRSILFRIQTELGEKEGYNQLSAESDGSSLQLISAQPDPSLSLSSKPHGPGQVHEDEAAPTPSSSLSTASVYSQDSWQQTGAAIPSASPSPSSPEPPKAQEFPPKASEALIQTRPTPVNRDSSHRSEEHRRYAMALSPSMDWELGAAVAKSPSLVPLDLATRFIVDINLIKSLKDNSAEPPTDVRTSSRIISGDSPTTPTTADPFRAGGDGGGSFFLFQPEQPDQPPKKLLRKKSTHARTQSESGSSAKSSSAMRKALSRLTFAPSRERADLPQRLRRTKSQLVSPPPLIPTANAQLPALHFSPIQLKLPSSAIPSAATAMASSSSDSFARAEDSPYVKAPATPGPGPRTVIQKQEFHFPLPPPLSIPRRNVLKKVAPDMMKRSYSPPPQLPTIAGTPFTPNFVENVKSVEDQNTHSNHSSTSHSSLPALRRRTISRQVAPNLTRRSHSPPPQRPTESPSIPNLAGHTKPAEKLAPPTVSSLSLGPSLPGIPPSHTKQATPTVVATLKRAPPPRLPLVSQAPQVAPKKVHKRYASSPAVLNFRPQDLPAMPPPPLPDLSKKLVELERMQMQRNMNMPALRM